MGITAPKGSIDMLNDWDGPRDEPKVDKEKLLASKLEELDKLVAEIKQIVKDLTE